MYEICFLRRRGFERSKENHTVLKMLLQTSKDVDPETLTSRMILPTAAAVGIPQDSNVSSDPPG